MTLPEAVERMGFWISRYAGESGVFLYIALAAGIYLLLFSKQVRIKIMMPIVLMAMVVLNPILYQILFSKIIYWRFFWILQDVVLIGLALTDLCGRFKQGWIRCLCLLLCSGGIVLLGTNVFRPEQGRFIDADSPYKVDPETREVCEVILADNPHPTLIISNWLFSETRQYSGDIIQLFGRDGDGYIYEMDPAVRAFEREFRFGNMSWEEVFQYAMEHNFTHVCFYDRYQIDDIAEQYGYECLAVVGPRIIYHQLPG